MIKMSCNDLIAPKLSRNVDQTAAGETLTEEKIKIANWKQK